VETLSTLLFGEVMPARYLYSSVRG
jgi:hypothetical protein